MSRALHGDRCEHTNAVVGRIRWDVTRLLLIAIAAVTIVTSGCSKTEGTKAASSAAPGARPGAVGSGGAGANLKSDDDFVRDVAIKNMAAIELSRVALDKAADLTSSPSRKR